MEKELKLLEYWDKKEDHNSYEEYRYKYGFPPIEPCLEGFFYFTKKKREFDEEEKGILISYYGEPINSLSDSVKDIINVHFPLLKEDGGREPWATDLEMMRIYVNHPYRKNTLINQARCLFFYSPYENVIFDRENINHIRKAIQTYVKVSEDPIFQEVLDKYHWNEGDEVKVKLALQRFIKAQDHGSGEMSDYKTALQEIKNGKKETHWIWYIFPQMKGLGHSVISEFYGIEDREEAYTYMEDPILSSRLIEATEAVLNNEHSAYEIFGNDVIKFRSCMLLFSTISDNPIFKKILRKYCWN